MQRRIDPNILQEESLKAQERARYLSSPLGLISETIKGIPSVLGKTREKAQEYAKTPVKTEPLFIKQPVAQQLFSRETAQQIPKTILGAVQSFGPATEEEARQQFQVKIGKDMYLDPTGAVGSIEDISGRAISKGLASISKAKTAKEPSSIFQGLKTTTTKLLQKFRGLPNEITPQQFNEVINKAQKEGIKKVDLDMVRGAAKEVNGKISLPQLAKDVEVQLVPLTPTPVKSPRWANIGEDYIGDGKYGEIVYQSPIKTSAGDVHFQGRDVVRRGQLSKEQRERISQLNDNVQFYRRKLSSASDTRRQSLHQSIREARREISTIKESVTEETDNFPNYFSHVRYEDMADGKTRKILETQSDLGQKGNILREKERMLGEVHSQLSSKGVMDELRQVFPKIKASEIDDYIRNCL